MGFLAISHLVRATFCWLPPLRLAAGVSADGVLICRRIDPARRHMLLAPEIEEGPRIISPQMSERHVLPDVEATDDTLRCVARPEDSRRRCELRRAGPLKRDGRVIDQEFAAIGASAPNSVRQSDFPPRALHTGDPEHLAGMEIEAHCPHTCPARRSSRTLRRTAPLRPSRRRLLAVLMISSRPSISCCSSAISQLSGSRSATQRPLVMT